MTKFVISVQHSLLARNNAPMKVLCGLSDSLAGVVDNPAKCEHCHGTTWLEGGLCVHCLLNTGLDQESAVGATESLESLLAEVNVPDQQWRLGNYEILEEIGRGGMGVIYRARQRHSRRIVAVKRVLSYHSDSRETLERFRREAEAAASLDHPNILPIYEVSESEGLPYFSMKFATGGSLQDVAHSARNDPKQWAAAVAKVARAIGYAHDQGILHRDLKPGNILLDGRAEPLISDFGLAKWLDATSDLTRTLTTFGTPGYIAPEQAEGRAADLTPAADVYSIGAILFDLLTGRPPFKGEHALSVIHQAAERPAPKLRSIVPSLDRDLETICARCLEREPKARYQSAADLADDLERWLECKPIKARRVLPPTRIWRWSRRNRKLVATAAAFLFVGAASIWLLWQEGWVPQISGATKRLLTSSQQQAEESKLQQALIIYPQLLTELEQSHISQSREAVKARLYRVLAERVGLDAKLMRDKLPKLAEVVKRDRDRAVYERASAAYIGADYPDTERLALQAADDAAKARPARKDEAIHAFKLASLAARKSNEYARAREHLGEAEKLLDRERDPGNWADIQEAIGDLFLKENQHFDEAETIIRKVVDLRTQIYGPENRDTLRARGRLAYAFFREEKNAEAEAEYRDLVRLDTKILGAENSETLLRRRDLAVAMADGDNPAGALAEFRDVLRIREKRVGPEDPSILGARSDMAVALVRSGQTTEATAQNRELLKAQEKVLGPANSETLNTCMNLGSCLAELGEYQEGEAMLRRAATGFAKTAGPDNHSTLYCRYTLAMTLAAEGRLDEAEQEARDIVKLNDKATGVDREGWTRAMLADVLDKQGRHAEAEPQIRQAVNINQKGLGPDSDETRNSRGHLAKNLWFQGKHAEAETLLRDLITSHEKMLGTKVYRVENNVSSRLFEEPTPLQTRTLLANTLRDQKKLAEAEDQYKEIIQLEEKVLGPDHRDTLNTVYNYAFQLSQQGRLNEARPRGERAAKGAVTVLGAGDLSTRKYGAFLTALESNQPIVLSEAKFNDSFVMRNSSVPQAAR
jgi:serine/threonine protein kinase